MMRLIRRLIHAYRVVPLLPNRWAVRKGRFFPKHLDTNTFDYWWTGASYVHQYCGTDRATAKALRQQLLDGAI